MSQTVSKSTVLGMTLIEVMVAIFIFAITASAILRSGSEHLHSTAMIKDITFAGWVANNRINEMLIEPTWPIKNNQTGVTELAERQWYWRQRVDKTNDDGFIMVTIDVAKDKAFTDIVTSLSSYLGKPEKVNISS